MQICKQFTKNFFYFFIFFVTFFFINEINAQNDTLAVKKIEKKNNHSVATATWLATFVPGAGQIYNKKYWKVPLLYGGLGTLGYFIYFNNQLYLDFKDSFDEKYKRVLGLPYNPSNDPFPNLRIETVRLNRDYSARNRNFIIIITGLVHGLSILDAHVDAHLKTFDVSDKLTLKIEPYQDYIQNNPFAGVSFKLHWKK
ncbi:MAG: hypothetical protein EAZ44_07435 [Cytophagia bacterium]|nr:MAG: hypothetical protein EAZ44_07435 [Cytophagia bacterium]TAH29733.1 MAG: hypothetical protein EAZ06_05750 [Cytophagales bacterium]